MMRKRVKVIVPFILCSLSAISTIAQEGVKDRAQVPAKKNPVVLIKTEFGEIRAELFADKAPITVANFLHYITEKKVHNPTFYRIVRTDPDNQPDNAVKIQVLQGGLTDVRDRDLPQIKHETTKETGVLHKDGVLSMARNAPGTATHHFSICIGDQPELDFGGKRNPDGQGFAAFGKVIEGMDVVRKIHREQQPQGQYLRPRLPMLEVSLVDAGDGNGRTRSVGKLVPIGPAFAGNDINAVSFRKDALSSVVAGDRTYQFAAYYRQEEGERPNRRVTIARRLIDSSQWQIFDQPFGDTNSNGNDSHNTISFGIDGHGVMHLSYGMHNHRLVYRKSTESVLSDKPIAFGDIRPMIGEGGRANFENSVTYPQFYHLPSGDLLFFYRNGGSGDGNSFLNRYHVESGQWSALQRPLFDGARFSVNAYPNMLAFDSRGSLHLSWTDRSTPAFQTNHNLYYARSADEGRIWTKMDGWPFTAPITEATAEVAVAIPEQSTLINQASMTVDIHDWPVIATWWAPRAAEGDHTRQYMLAWYDGSSWKTSPITSRPSEPKQTDATVRDLARPIVLIDENNRAIVVLRFKERGNVVTIAHSENRTDWQLVDISTEPLGIWEPTYDAALWQRENKLHLLYQPVGLGETTSTISVLEWDARKR
jgi:cyclophilin family peptidyl-prolyl cis-trans isomerase